MNTHIYIQAQVGSTRLPRKVLEKAMGKTMIHLLWERLTQVKNANKIILVTGPKDLNADLINEAENIELDYFSGSEQNLLDRYYHASQKYDSHYIVRVTADCPLIDYNLIDKGIKIFTNSNQQGKKIDILICNHNKSLPHGMNFQIFTKKTLHSAWSDTKKNFPNLKIFEDTFINPIQYILEADKFEKYHLANICKDNMRDVRLTLDYPEDLQLIKQIFKELYEKKKFFTLNDILQLLKEKPSLIEINKHRINVV